MTHQPVKFYQTGTFTIGNRLLAPEARGVQADVKRANSLNSGHRACQGCGEALGARYAIDAAMSATGVASGAIPGMNGVAVCAEARRLSRMASCSWGSRIGFDMLVAP